MEKNQFQSISKYFLISTTLLFSCLLFAQQQTASPKMQSDFWRKVQFGGGIGLSFGGGYTDISLAPSAIYNINPYVATGIALQYSYVSSKNYYDSSIYGASLLVLVNPIPQIQLSATLNESRVNNNYESVGPVDRYSEDFWNTALFLGVGYRTGNVTVGLSYNVLFDENDNVYGDALTPFIRAYF